jgi:hypothetical protein
MATSSVTVVRNSKLLGIYKPRFATNGINKGNIDVTRLELFGVHIHADHLHLLLENNRIGLTKYI